LLTWSHDYHLYLDDKISRLVKKSSVIVRFRFWVLIQSKLDPYFHCKQQLIIHKRRVCVCFFWSSEGQWHKPNRLRQKKAIFVQTKQESLFPISFFFLRIVSISSIGIWVSLRFLFFLSGMKLSLVRIMLIKIFAFSRIKSLFRHSHCWMIDCSLWYLRINYVIHIHKSIKWCSSSFSRYVVTWTHIVMSF